MNDLQFNLMQWLWLLVCLQLTLFSIGWLMASRASDEFRTAMRHVSIFNLANALALLLVSLRGHWPSLLTDAVADILVLVGFVRVWTGAFHLLNAQPGRQDSTQTDQQEPWVVFALGTMAILFLSAAWPSPQLRVLSLVVCLAWICVRGGRKIYLQLHDQGFQSTALGIFLTGNAIGAGLIIHAVLGIYNQTTIAYDQVSASSMALPFLLLFGIFAVNLLYAFTVSGKIARELHAQSRRDALTGLPNRRAVMEFLDTKWTQFKQHGEELAVVCVDIDHFKRINDKFGHAIGDQVLSAVATHLAGHVREQDLIARFGGEEFFAIFPDTPLSAAAEIAERLCRSIHETPGLHPVRGEQISVSVGLVSATDLDTRLDDLITRADHAMYRAKRNGRNRLAIDAHPILQDPMTSFSQTLRQPA